MIHFRFDLFLSNQFGLISLWHNISIFLYIFFSYAKNINIFTLWGYVNKSSNIQIYITLTLLSNFFIFLFWKWIYQKIYKLIFCWYSYGFVWTHKKKNCLTIELLCGLFGVVNDKEEEETQFTNKNEKKKTSKKKNGNKILSLLCEFCDQSHWYAEVRFICCYSKVFSYFFLYIHLTV